MVQGVKRQQVSPLAVDPSRTEGELGLDGPFCLRHGIVDRAWAEGLVGDITAALIGCGQIAIQRGDQAWMERHRWFGEAIDRLFNDQPAVPLDG